jgi:branched-chain amino acid transport system ATP-binding protein
MLRADGLVKHFGGVAAVENCTLEIAKGGITGLIGPNGAGKTTLFNLLSGFEAPDAGEIRFKGELISGLPPYETFRRGLCRTFQISREFANLTVLENLTVVPFAQPGEGLWQAIVGSRAARRAEQATRERAQEALALVHLAAHADKAAHTLSVGQKRLLDVARAIMANAELLLLDEPAAGVNPVVRRELGDFIEKLVSDRGITVLLIEHDIELVMRLCRRVIVMDQGSVLMEGTPDEVRQDERVLRSYLGASRR